MKDIQVVSTFDIGSLKVVSEEVRVCLDSARDALGESGDVAQAASALHAAKGALDLANMEGAARFCAAVENFVATMGRGEVPSSREHLDTAGSAVDALVGFIAAVLEGLPNNPLTLYSSYLEISRALGLGNAVSKADLFFPDTSVFVPKSLESSPVEQDEVPKLAKSERSVYERGLLAWLRRRDVRGLKGMREAIIAIERTQIEPKERTFWWIATALMDALLHEGIEPNDEVNRALGRINFQIRRLVNGQSHTPEPLLREVLYFVGLSGNVGGRVAEAKRMFNLDAYLSEAREISLEGERGQRMQLLLGDLRQILDAAPAHWMKFIGSAGVDGRQPVVSDFTRIRERFATAGRSELAELAEGMISALDAGEDRLEAVALEVSSSLMLMEIACENFNRLAEDFEKAVEAQRNRLARAVSGGIQSFEGDDNIPLLDEIGRKAQERNLLATVVREIHGNIAEMELALDEFFRDEAKRTGLFIIKQKAEQILGALSMLDLGKACDVIKGFSLVTEPFAGQGYTPAPGEMELCAELLTALDVYLGEIAHGNMEAERKLYPVLERLGHGDAVARTTEFDVPSVLTTEAARGVSVNRDTVNGDDPELLDVFLEEAEEVLGNINRNIEACRADPGDRAALTDIRRGFHTLKGSGRMVGLYSIGEAAWAMEQVFNKWLEEDRSATGALLDLSQKAHGAFKGWVEGLRASGSIEVSSELGVQADAFREGRQDIEPPTALVVPDAVIEGEPESGEIVVGDTVISAQLFSIFSKEAQRCLSALDEQFERFRHDRFASYDFMRAAHTLCGISGTVQLGAISELSYALERLLTELMHPAVGAKVEANALLEEAIGVLRGKVDGVVNGIAAQSEPGLIDALVRMAQEAAGASEVGVRDDALGVEVPAISEGDFVDDAARGFLVEEVGAAVAPTDQAESIAIPYHLENGLAGGEEDDSAPALAEDVGDDEMLPEPTSLSALVEEIEEIKNVFAANTDGEREERGPEGIFGRLSAAVPGIDDDIDEQLLQVFLEEAQDAVPSLGEHLRDWRKQPASQVVSGAVRRSLHTIKGSARMVGAMRLGQLAHNMETLAIEAVDRNTVDADVFGSLQDSFDLIDGVVRAMERGEFADAKPEATDGAAGSLAAPETILDAMPSLPAKQVKSLIRVHSEVIDALATDVGEASIARSRVEGELLSFKQGLKDMGENVSRLKAQLREIEIQAETQMQSRVSDVNQGLGQFDPLEFDRFTRLQELTRMAAESVSDISALQASLQRNLGESEAAVSQQARLAKEVQQALMRIRLVPIRTVGERLRQVVRQTAKELGKPVEVEIVGDHIELDRGVLDRITAPLEHLLRNAVDHGVEMPDVRVAAGKPGHGLVKIGIERERDEVVIEVSDDGAGIDLEKVRAKAASMGLIRMGQIVSDAKLYDFLFWAGFSTASKVTQVSGRGIGMDVVRSEITQLGGRIELDSKAGDGSRFKIYLPTTMATMHVILVVGNGEMFAVPGVMVEQVQVMKELELVEAYRVGAVDWMGTSYPLFYLPKLFGVDVPVVKARYNTIVLLRSGRYSIALHIDRLLSNAEVVTKNIGRQLAAVPGVVGATVLADGSEVVIVNPVVLAREFLGHVIDSAGMVDEKIAPSTLVPAQIDPAGAAYRKGGEESGAAAANTVMVVDDSLTVRKITRRLLEREGYRVIDAKDGLDALEKLRDEKPGIMLVDIEMPRMDGFELTKNVRAEASTKHIPIIMITSRTAEKHRNHAFDLGVNVYLGKPYQDTQLLASIRELIGAPVGA